MTVFNLNKFKSRRLKPESIEEGEKRYIIRDGRRIEIRTLGQLASGSSKTKRKTFKPKFGTLPMH